MRHGIAGRILVSLVGAALILYNAGAPVLAFVGARASAVVTSVRRQGGERNEAVPGRYTYSVGYAFTLPDGREINGSTTNISGAAYLKADGTSRIPVRYVEQAPFFNVPERDAKPSAGHLIGLGAGILIIVLVNRRGGVSKREKEEAR